MASQDPYFDMLPNELVAKILKMSMHTESFLCFGHLIWYLKQPLFAKYEHQQSTMNPYGRPKEPLKTEHGAHLFDWFRMNRTSRRFREIGKPAYWQCKTIVMSKEFATDCLKGHDPNDRGLTPEDRDLALRNIRNAIVYNVRTYSPSFFIGLPKYMAQFPTLRSLVLSNIGGVQDTATAVFVSAAEARERGRKDRDKEYAVDIPRRLRALLWAVGVDPCVSVMILTLPWTWAWEEAVGQLQESVYPMLELRVKLLKSQRERVSEAEKSVLGSGGVD